MSSSHVLRGVHRYPQGSRNLLAASQARGRGRYRDADRHSPGLRGSRRLDHRQERGTHRHRRESALSRLRDAGRRRSGANDSGNSGPPNWRPTRPGELHLSVRPWGASASSRRIRRPSRQLVAKLALKLLQRWRRKPRHHLRRRFPGTYRRLARPRNRQRGRRAPRFLSQKHLRPASLRLAAWSAAGRLAFPPAPSPSQRGCQLSRPTGLPAPLNPSRATPALLVAAPPTLRLVPPGRPPALLNRRLAEHSHHPLVPKCRLVRLSRRPLLPRPRPRTPRRSQRRPAGFYSR